MLTVYTLREDSCADHLVEMYHGVALTALVILLKKQTKQSLTKLLIGQLNHTCFCHGRCHHTAFMLNPNDLTCAFGLLFL